MAKPSLQVWTTPLSNLSSFGKNEIASPGGKIFRFVRLNGPQQQMLAERKEKRAGLRSGSFSMFFHLNSI